MFLVDFGDCFFSVFECFLSKMSNFRCFVQIICAAGGQHEEHTVLRSPVRDVVSKTSTEPKAAHLEGFWVGFFKFDARCELLFILYKFPLIV